MAARKETGAQTKALPGAGEYREIRLDILRKTQNPDGGWGYSPRRQSWLEPTCYAMLALQADKASAEAVGRGWKLIRSWQMPDGAWRPGPGVNSASWAGALCLSLHCVRGVFDQPFERGIRWLLNTTGSEGGLLERIFDAIRPPANTFDRTVKGWPWRPDSASWVEPTAHALVALKLARHLRSRPEVQRSLDAGANWMRRIKDAEGMLIDRRTVDGGWNYGNRRVLETNLPAYPETTGVALLGLQGSPLLEVKPALQIAERLWRKTESPLARAWLAIALRNYGHPLAVEYQGAAAPDDILITALEAMAFPEGGHQCLKIL